ILFGTKHDKFDSELVEPGPPFITTKNEIVFIYNSKNSLTKEDKSLPEGLYSAAQFLADKNNPEKVIDRSDNNFFKPDKDYEMIGQIDNFSFLEGLAPR
ncbi:MAG: hypothetical protein WKF91_15170, partial [Segetibacter sp.]